jgi:thiol-disulfide isomerase/thioredoxin
MPGFSLNISFDAANFSDSYRISGKGSAENVILDSVYNECDRIDWDLFNFQTPEVVIPYIDSMYKVNRDYLARMISIAKVDPQFQDYASASLEYDFAFLKHFREDINKIINEEYPDSIDKLYVEHEKYLDIESYRNFLVQTIYDKAENDSVKEDAASMGSPQKILDAKLTVIEKFKSQPIKEYLIFEAISKYLKNNGVKHFTAYYDYFRKNISDPLYASLIENEYQKKLRISPGQPAPGFSAEDVDGKIYTLENFKGRNLYIDTWATWCGWCIKEDPYFEKLVTEYQGEDIVFLCISLDVKRKLWEDYLNKNKKEGLNLFAVSGFDSELAEGFQITAIPTFILIDKDGKIVDADAPRPSSPEIRKALDELLARH